MTIKEKETGKACGYNRDEFQCPHPLYDEEHCIFHSKDFEGKKEKFNNEFWKEFKRQEQTEEKFNFMGFVFPKGISFKRKNFKKDVNFYDATFEGSAIFQNATFQGKVKFNAATFKREAKFYDTSFEKKAGFKKTIFKGIAGFNGAIFARYAGFDQAEFGENEVRFIETTFIGKAGFNGVMFKNISKVFMVDTHFYDALGLMEILDKNKNERGISETKTEFLSKNIQIILGEKSAARFPSIDRQIKDDRFLMKYREKHSVLHFFWWLFADCGRSLGRWGLWSIFLALFFALIYHNCFYLTDSTTFNQANIHVTWPSLSFIYYSVVTFTTLGFGDIVPKPGWLQFWVMLEVILGYIMLGGLISILANKLARRS